MAKKKTGNKVAPKDRPSGQPVQPAVSTSSTEQQAPASSGTPASARSGSAASNAPASVRESRPPAPSSIVPAEPTPVAKIVAPDPPPPVEQAPPKDPASTAPVVKDIDEDGEASEQGLRAEAGEKPEGEAVPSPSPKPSAEPASAVAASVDPSLDRNTGAPAAGKTSRVVAPLDPAGETPPASERGKASTEDAGPPGKSAEAEALAPSRAASEDEPPPSSTRAPESRDGDTGDAGAKKSAPDAPEGTKSAGKKKKKKKQPGDAKSAAGEDEAPPSSRRLRLDGQDDGHDDFFNQPDEKVRQKHYVAETFEEEEPRFRPLSADDLARRAKLRRIVTIVVGTAAAACLLVGIRLSMGTKHADPPPLDRSQIVIAAPPPPKPQPALADPAPTAPADKAAAVPAASDSAASAGTGAPSGAASGAPAASASAAPAASAPGGPVDAEEAKKLAKNALKALESGNNKLAVERASAAVDADPADATGYLYWGTALMNMGKLSDAKKIFQGCVEKATRGPKAECRQFRLSRVGRSRHLIGVEFVKEPYEVASGVCLREALRSRCHSSGVAGVPPPFRASDARHETPIAPPDLGRLGWP